MTAPTAPTLTPREKEVITLVAHGYSRDEITGILRFKNPQTVSAIVSGVRFRLGAHTAAHAVWLCVQQRILDPFEDPG